MYSLGISPEAAQNHNNVSLSSIPVSQGGEALVSDMCPDPGIPEFGRRAGADFRWEIKAWFEKNIIF